MRRLVALVLAAGVVLSAAPAVAATTSTAATSTGTSRAAAERDAVTVLDRAAAAGRSLHYTGTQYVASWRASGSGATLVDVTHRPGQAPVVREQPTAGATSVALTATASLDPRLVGVLAQRYDLRLAGSARCAGRTATVVEAYDGARLAGRFWVDRDSSLVLRREVYDDDGRRVRSSAFVDLQVRDAGPPAEPGPRAEPVARAAAALRDAGWRVPRELPHGFRLFETRLSTPSPGGELLHLAYSDGLSTTSLFVQPGRLGTEPVEGFVADEVDDRPVWVHHEMPERVVWSGSGHVWTLVSDASAAAVHDAVAALPRDPAPRDGLRARLGRGLARLGSMLNPFD